jgi:arabinogalactan endo-1,4-beta-galactosidase
LRRLILRYGIISLIYISIFSCEKSEDPEKNDDLFYTGMDLSYQLFLEEKNLFYRDEEGDIIFDLLKYLKENGVELVRLRLFHSPVETNPVVYACRLDKVLEYAERAHNNGMEIMLDIHYSDTWADPGHQHTPLAWKDITFEAVSDSIYEYTKMVLERFSDRGFYPEFVQIGNETNSGFLWDYGKVWNDFEDNWPKYAKLVERAAAAINYHEKVGNTEIRKIIHIAGVVNKQFFFDGLTEYFSEFDIIGLSHYPHHHTKDLNEMQESLNFLADRYNKEIFIVETSYPFTLGYNDWTHNVLGSRDDLIDGYAATPLGQKYYYEKMVEILKSIPGNKGLGFVWWAPDYVAFDGPQSTNGSSFENLTVFDFDNKVLPVIDIFRNN